VGDRLNMVFNGTAVAQGTGRALVTAAGVSTEMGRIAHLLDASVMQPTPLQQEVARVGRMLGIAVLVVALVVWAPSCSRDRRSPSSVAGWIGLAARLTAQFYTPSETILIDLDETAWSLSTPQPPAFKAG
jgi:magnesium-transporting ATPase (P-type)